VTTKEKAKRLLELFGPTGQHWTTRAFARNKEGKPICEINPKAVKWCLLGACNKLKFGEAWLEKAVAKQGWYSVPSFNDEDGFDLLKHSCNAPQELNVKPKEKTK
jgi:hypothetical protein